MDSALRRYLLFIILAATAFWLASCGAKIDSTPDIYRPPTLEDSAGESISPTQIPSADAPHPSPVPQCEDDLLFVKDLTLPDGTIVPPGAETDKRWLVENAGTCNWDAGYRLRLISGGGLNIDAEQALYPALAGTQAMLQVRFTAPTEPGTYRAAWQAHRPGGEAFGDPIYMEIVIPES
ncbi:MAG: hypothetical protein B6I38_03000 [Anaerolineaceae bacterium 4572_5.1]|nr:MAG: hypothetical protein B6I38_03000 [Anaerolineaceae bacterium 4572_5.1]